MAFHTNQADEIINMHVVESVCGEVTCVSHRSKLPMTGRKNGEEPSESVQVVEKDEPKRQQPCGCHNHGSWCVRPQFCNERRA